MSTDLAPTSAPASPTAVARARRWRLPAILGGLVVLLAVIVALTSESGAGTLDIDSYSKDGSHAVATLLRDRGTQVTQVRTLGQASATSGGTLVVVGSNLLLRDQAERLAASRAGTVVVFGAFDTDVVDAFAGGTEVVRTVDESVLEPACALPAATLAGRADAGVATYRSAPGAGTSVGCYPTGGDASVLDVRQGARRVVLVGNPSILKNERLGEEGNAALALNLLGEDGAVTWYLPSLGDLYGESGDESGQSPFSLVPDGVVGGVVWVAIVTVLLALWRARRFGPVVEEALPVVVRAAETDEGRARLYRRGRSRDRAAQLLRAATIDRLSAALGVTERSVLIQTVAARTGRHPNAVAALLYGAAPPDDAVLVALAGELDRLEREVRGA